MGRPRLTVEQLKAKGIGPASPNWSRYKDRILKADKTVVAPVVTAKDPLRKSPPKHMVDKQQRALWTKIVSTAPPGALGSADEIAVELAVFLYQKLLKNELKPSEASQFKLILVSFGMFPSHQKAENTPAQPAPAKKSYDLLAELEKKHAGR
jgi:hypothetical protein